jgi:PAS domain S-box-containing protein
MRQRHGHFIGTNCQPIRFFASFQEEAGLAWPGCAFKQIAFFADIPSIADSLASAEDKQMSGMEPITVGSGCQTACTGYAGKTQGDPANYDRFREVFESAPFGVCLVGLDTRYLLVNRLLCQMLGYSAEELLESRCTQLTHPDDLGLTHNLMEQLIKKPDSCLTMEKRFIHRDGAVIWVHSRISLARDSDGSPLHFVVHMEDITERKQANEALRDSEERFRVIADSCPSMMWATDTDGNVRFFNRACREFIGIDSERMNRGQWKRFFHPDDGPMFMEDFDLAIKERKPFSIEARVRRADGAWRLLGWRAESRYSQVGEFQGYIGLCADITERIQAEQARQFELSLLESIHAETLEGILVVNQAGIVVSYNKRFLGIWGLDDSTAQGSRPHSFIGSEDRTLMLSVLERLEDPDTFALRVQELHNHPDEEDHCEFRSKDGRTLERHSTGLKNSEGIHLGRVWFFRDITPHKQVEASLQRANDLADEANQCLLAERSMLENERRILRALIDNIPDFMYVKDTECRFVVANSSFARTAGVQTPEKLLGKTDFDILPPDRASSLYEDDQTVIRTGQPLFNREEKGLDAAGNEIYILTTRVPLRDSHGQVVGVVGVGHDISLRKKMENELRQAEQKYRGIFDSAIIGIVQSTPDGRFLSMNQATARIHGYDSPEEMMASVADIACNAYVDPQRREEFKLLMEKDGAAKNFEFEAFRKDGSRFWISLSAVAICENGVVVRHEAMIQDVTERKQLREQLLQAQKLESVGALAAGIAHEINSPTQYIGDNVRFLKDAFRDLKSLLENYERLLSAAKNNALSSETVQEVWEAVECIDTGYLLDEIPKAIDQTLEGITRVSTIVGAMKEFSHPDIKEKVPLDLNRAITSTITVARNEWKYVAEMETELDPSLPPVLCLPGEFNQVILNLLVNAAHAIADVVRKGGPAMGKIKVQTLNCPEWAEIRIQDTGTGIPEKVQNRIYDPFFTTKEIGKGTGQGLAIARSVIINKHGGSIHFETEAGKGTTFIIRLPHNGKAIPTMKVAV